MNESKVCERIKVVVRCRPLSQDEEKLGYSSVVKVSNNNEVEIIHPKHDGLEYIRKFQYDLALGHECKQHEVYEHTARPLVDSVLNGFNATIFAYGQSGSGKSYTMEGNSKVKHCVGVSFRAIHHIFDNISKSTNVQYLVRVTYIEIYQDEINDLLNNSSVREKCDIKESKDSGVYVKNLKAFVCNDLKQINAVISAGNKRRTTGYTSLNEKSSRSHAILTVTLEMKDMVGPMENIVRVGKLNLVDLAGSERQLKSNACGDRLKESNKINLSLTALGNVISALTQPKTSYIPYRDSKLTRLLRDSIGGNSKTLMIANIGPASISYDESLNTLRFASRVGMIKNKPKINEDPTDALLRMYQEEITRLKAKLNSREIKQTNQRTKLKTNFSSYDVNERSDPLLTDMFYKSSYISEESNLSMKFDRECVADLTRRIDLMEGKLLSGASNVFEHTNNLQEALNTRNNFIMESIQREKDMQEILELNRETTAEVQNEYYNLSTELDVKRKTLKRTLKELDIVGLEIINTHNKFNVDRRSLENTRDQLIKRIKLKLLIVDNFIPQHERRKVMDTLHFNPELEAWKCKQGNKQIGLLNSLKSIENSRRPLTMFTVISSRKAEYMFQRKQSLESERKTFRYKSENIVRLNLVRSPKMSKNYVPPAISPAIVRNILKNALQEEDYLDIDARYSSAIRKNGFFGGVSTSFIQDVKSCQIRTPSLVYPKARGLVRK